MNLLWGGRSNWNEMKDSLSRKINSSSYSTFFSLLFRENLDRWMGRWMAGWINILITARYSLIAQGFLSELAQWIIYSLLHFSFFSRLLSRARAESCLFSLTRSLAQSLLLRIYRRLIHPSLLYIQANFNFISSLSLAWPFLPLFYGTWWNKMRQMRWTY